MTELADELDGVVDEASNRLRGISESVAAAKARPEAWSVKEIVGHLLDSAANNHQRFIRAQLVHELTFPGYEQDAWVRVQGYQERPWLDLIDFWVLSNRQLSQTMRRIPASTLQTTCRIGTDDPVTLGFLMQDYLDHLRHHLKQITERTAA
jgi:DinB superfamily